MYTHSLYKGRADNLLNADGELLEIIKVKKYIDQIPNNKDYYLLHNISTCEPIGLSDEDKVDFDKKCALFTEKGITAANVNNPKILKQLRILNMPYGGKTVESIWESPNLSDIFSKINNALIKLLEHGIGPLNELNFNHLDVKDDNIVISDDNKARLIDWGLASENDGTVPETLSDSFRAFQYNLPVSHVLFHMFNPANREHTMMTRSMKIKSPKKTTIKSPLKKSPLKKSPKYEYIWNKIKIQLGNENDGHYSLIIRDISRVQHILKKHPLDTAIEPTSIIKYINAVLFATQFRKSIDEFDGDKYFNDVFKYNADVYGFLMAYRPLLTNAALRIAIAKILFRYCYSPEYATKRIPIDELAADLKKLNDIII
jgi:serine/threonine protein kinase